MLATGIIGMISGLLFNRRNKEGHTSKFVMILWGLCSTSVIYGGIMSLYEFIFVQNSNFFALFLISFSSVGIWHSIATVVFLMFLMVPVGKILVKFHFSKNYFN
jgi:hypothetical protein